MTEQKDWEMVLSKKEVEYIMHELSLNFLIKECRDVLRLLTEHAKQPTEKK